MAILACARCGTRKVSVEMVVAATADVATWLLACLVRTAVLDVKLVVFSLQLYKVEVAVRFDSHALVLESLKMGPPRCKGWLDGDRTRFIHRCLLRVDFAISGRSANQHADQMQFIRRMLQQIAVDRAIHALSGEQAGQVQFMDLAANVHSGQRGLYGQAVSPFGIAVFKAIFPKSGIHLLRCCGACSSGHRKQSDGHGKYGIAAPCCRDWMHQFSLALAPASSCIIWRIILSICDHLTGMPPRAEQHANVRSRPIAELCVAIFCEGDRHASIKRPLLADSSLSRQADFDPIRMFEPTTRQCWRSLPRWKATPISRSNVPKIVRHRHAKIQSYRLDKR
jgi:hypothetical protein